MEIRYRKPVIKDRIETNILALIEEEVAKDVLPIQEKDPETMELLETTMRDYRMSQYLFLQWLTHVRFFHKVLYAGSGFDVIPKLAFGEDRVVHTSLEDHKVDDVRYFPSLGSGMKVLADNGALPFAATVFDAILIFCLPADDVRVQKTELVRVLKNNGLIVSLDSVFNDSESKDIFGDFTPLPVPAQFQNRGEAKMRFSLFAKTVRS